MALLFFLPLFVSFPQLFALLLGAGSESLVLRDEELVEIVLNGEGELEQTGFGLEIAFEMAPLLTLNASFVLVQRARPTVPRRRDSICPP